uniref:SAP domain-containing protein n=1 Tax=Homalodisca liturata TaxID=320908 RepID=A0A1B6HYQ2_9HEMI
MSQFGGGDVSKPPWLSQGQMVTGQLTTVTPQSQVQPQMITQMGPPATMTMLQYQPAQVYQQTQMTQLQQPGLAMQTIGVVGTNQITPATGLTTSLQQSTTMVQQPQIYQQMGTVSYPTRTMLSAPFTSQATVGSGTITNSSAVPGTGTPKQRVFTGTVTKVQDNFGFVDEEVFFQTSCCQGAVPQVGDKVLVDASYNANMPFKWNATRVQILQMENNLKPLPPGTGRGRRFSNNPQSSFVDVPDTDKDDLDTRRSRDGGGRLNKRNRRNNFLRKRRREELRNERLREEKEKETQVEREKERQKTPPPRKTKTRSRKTVVATRSVGQIPLDTPEADVLELRKRYNSMYIPSDFFSSTFKWVEVFPPQRALSLGRPCVFHIMHKDVDPVMENDAVLDPPDANYLFSAKVMLLSMPQLYEMYQKCCPIADGKEGTVEDQDREYVHPTLLMNFVVGMKGKETMAIGGPWSPSLDGPNPDKDPKVLIKTAVRNCKALTGIDLTNCTQWYRFVEIYYHRPETIHKGKTVPAQVETVVLYLPDVWSRLPTRMEWDGLHHNYKKKLDQLLQQKREAEGDDKDPNAAAIPKKEPTHYAQLDPKNMKLTELREELEARNLPSKGMTAQLIARLIKVLKSEQDKEEKENASKTEAEKIAAAREKEKEEERKKKEEEEKKKQKEREIQLLEKKYILPEKSHILVHPSRTAKGGKFDCTVMSLSELLDYRQDNSKEHSFEVFLFAELFNGMLMRDFGFRIYKSLVEAPEKTKEEKDDKDSKSKDKKSEKDKKDEEKNNSDDVDDKTKKEQAIRVTMDPYLLLAFVYFDQNLHGHLPDKVVEELLHSLGLQLSRSQIKKLVQKVESKGLVDYRKLTDRPKDEPKQNGTHSAEDLVTLACGNKRLLPIFDESISPKKRSKTKTTMANTGMPNGTAKVKGSTVNISKLQTEFKTSVDSCRQSEKLLEKLQTENERLNEQARRTSVAIDKLSMELHDFKERLCNTSSELSGVEGKTKWYFTLMNEIYEKLQPVFANKTEKKEPEDSHDTEMREDYDETQKETEEKIIV